MALPLPWDWQFLRIITIEHPELEVVFTTEEEVGMEGAIALDTADLKAKYLLNLDSGG